ncbi:hypothetical protein B808_1151 [Fructilactobacillus florum 8D]|uniref:Uncharacterized protein n=2 Tax=Fructilactobacillus florum TaxID=640331 RepID=W9ED95_9LACO|nr:hypothetical protein B808_1151 [Fructilactobacillus florum 8D]KRM91700.1 hypothetical protein FC87_GL000837 [Fructilactobacillus florum DSM 22689 = JCM 16035]
MFNLFKVSLSVLFTAEKVGDSLISVNKNWITCLFTFKVSFAAHAFFILYYFY